VSSLKSPVSNFIGRDAELAQLHGWLDKAWNGGRQIIFVTGEPGIGKTTLVDAFLERLETGDWRLAPAPQASSLKPQVPSLWIARGQCIEHYGTGEAYLPVLEALGQLCRGADGPRVITLLRRHAPTWLVQMPALLTDTEMEALQRKVQGVRRERMLRELAEVLEVLTSETLLVLVLEDLHWSDYSTVDLIPYLARRRGMARLLVLGTYRPTDVIASGHPLKGIKQELQAHHQCAEVALRLLSEEEVGQYLAARFDTRPSSNPQSSIPNPQSPPSLHPLAQAIHYSTEGNPLFMVTEIDYLVAQGVIGQVDGHWQVQREAAALTLSAPDNLRQLIERQFERLTPEEQRLLEAASVAGTEFSVAAVAAGVQKGGEQVEEQCGELARRGHFLRARSEMETWPDGTVAGRYGFLHALYQNVLCERQTAGSRMRLHQRIGERTEAGYKERTGEIAAELAMHFEYGHDYQRAVSYLQQAGEKAMQRSAPREAATYLSKGLALLHTMLDTPARLQQELLLLTTLGPALIVTHGYGDPEVGKVYKRTRELCQQLGETPQLFPVLWGMWYFHLLRGEIQTARELAAQCLSLAQRTQDSALLVEAHFAPADTLLWLGELRAAKEHFEQSLALYDPQQHRPLAIQYGQDPKVACLSLLALTLWSLGYPDQALHRSHENLNLAQELSHPYSFCGR
ncbi:MAG: ATP-binding protein, partial [Candidatus Binatia bacterium]